MWSKYCFEPYWHALVALRSGGNFNRATKPNSVAAARHGWIAQGCHHFHHFLMQQASYELLRRFTDKAQHSGYSTALLLYLVLED